MIRDVVLLEGSVVAFRTERLSARRMTPDDAAYLERLHRDASVMRFIGGVRDAEASGAWLARNLEHWDEYGYGQWMLDTDGSCIGRGGLRMIDECVGEDLVEVGYVIERLFWGQGFATEATRAFVEVAARWYGLDELGAITMEGNDVSTRVLEKCGFVHERWVDHPVGRHRFLRRR